MKGFSFVVSLFIVFLVTTLSLGCSKEVSNNDELVKRVMELESQVNTLKERQDDQTLKARIATGLVFKSPLEQFFQSPEFWENTYDVGEVECSKRCISDLTTHREQCAKIADDNQRLQCFNDASERASNCHRNCAQRFQ